MLSRRLLVLFLLLITLILTFSAHADDPVCEVACAPSLGSSTYVNGTRPARTKNVNTRGASSPYSAAMPSSVAGSTVIAGSESFNYAIPVLHLPGRNGFDLSLALLYNSHIWTLDSANNRVSLNADRDFPSYGFRIGFGFLEYDSNANKYTLTEPDGTKRELTLISGNSYRSQDGSYVTYDSSTKVLTRKNGIQWKYEQVASDPLYRPVEFKDTNGNYISITHKSGTGYSFQAIDQITDTLGRVVTFGYDTDKKLISITYPAFSTGTKTFEINWTSATLSFAFASPLTVADSLISGSSINVISACSYPDGSGYGLSYGSWGIVNQIDQKSQNGTVRSSVAYNFPGTSPALSTLPTFTTQTVTEYGPSHSTVATRTWTYSVTKSSGLVSAMEVTDPLGSKTITNLNTSGTYTGLTSSVVLKDSSNTTWHTTAYDWTWVSGAGPVPLRITTTLKDAPSSPKVEFTYTSYANVSEVKEYDYFTVLKRKTQTDYSTNSNYTSRNILNLPTQVRVYDGASSSPSSRTDFAYDTTSLTSVTGASHHDDTNYGSGLSYRGNVTSITRYKNASAGTGSIARTFSYDTLGNLISAQLDCCQERTWTFTSSLQYAYPTTLTSGPSGNQLSTSATYDFNTGWVVTTTDENSKTATLEYDSMGRVTKVVRSDNTEFPTAYTLTDEQSVITNTTPIDGSNNVVQVTTLDAMGRPIKQQTKDGSANVKSIVETQYDAIGRPFKVSTPYVTGETVKWTESQFDALGRITKVIPPDGSTSSNHTLFEYHGNRTTVTDPAGKQRRTYTDAFGKIVRVDEPGWSDTTPSIGQFSVFGEPDCGDPPILQNCSGSISVIVSDFTASMNYNSTSSAVQIASSLASQFNLSQQSPVTATYLSDGTYRLTSKLFGAGISYSVSSSGTGSGDMWAEGEEDVEGGTDGGGSTATPTLDKPLTTLSGYDVLNNLVQVIQGMQSRGFVYDSLGRLTQATTPEAGTVQFTYNDYSLVTLRKDARNVETNYQYDTLNRLIGISYTIPGGSGVSAMADVCTPSGGVPARVCFAYGTSSSNNNVGRLTTITEPTGSESYTYDSLGRITNLSKVISSATYTTQYSYNLVNALTSITYPSGRVVSQSFDAIGRLTTIASGGTNYLSSVAYNSASAPTGWSYGNGVNATLGYNDRIQLSSLQYSKSGTDLLKLAYAYTASGEGNNGQIRSITDSSSGTGTSGRSVDYTYDAWARLKTSLTTGSTQFAQWGLKWAYDRYGNRTTQTVTHGSGPSSSLTISTSTNRITDTGYSYDSSGNLTNDGLNALVYDGENHVTSSTQSGATANYTYDGGGLRIKKVSGSTTTIYIFSGTKVIAEYENGASVTSPTREYLYSGGQLLASLEGSTTRYHLNDHLSTRVLADTSGTAVAESGHFPFGESWYSSGSPGSLGKLKFTSYERDSESSNDYAMARYHINRLGRFNSPDPIAGSVADPQSMNRYAYIRNDPINLADPSGLAWDDDPAWLVAFRNGWWDNSYSMIMSLMGARTSGFFGGRFGSLPGMYDGTAEGEAKYLKTVQEAVLRNALREALKNPECAELLGEYKDRVEELVNSLRFTSVADPAWRPTSTLASNLTSMIQNGEAIAATLFGITSPMAGRLAILFARYSGGPINILYGSQFEDYTLSQLTTVAIHELMHVALTGTAKGMWVDARSPGDHPISIYLIARRCGTEVPPLQD